MSQNSQQMQVHLWADSKAVHRDLSLAELGQQTAQLCRFDQIGGAHPVTDVSDVGGAISGSRL